MIYSLYKLFTIYPVQHRNILTLSLPKYAIEIAFRLGVRGISGVSAKQAYF